MISAGRFGWVEEGLGERLKVFAEIGVVKESKMIEWVL